MEEPRNDNTLLHHRSQSTPAAAVAVAHGLHSKDLSTFLATTIGSHQANNNRARRRSRNAHRKSNSSFSNDSHNELLKALEKTGSFTGIQGGEASGIATMDELEERPALIRRWSSGATREDQRTGTLLEEKQLHVRRSKCESNIQQLFDERKEHIFELFQDTWVISDPLDE